jgi:hypothetical protein
MEKKKKQQKKKKKSSQLMNRWLFLASWVLAHIFAWAATFWLIGNYEPFNNVWWVELLELTFFIGIVPGTLLSFPQKHLMQRGLDLHIRWWRRVSVAAWGLGGLALWGIVEIFQFDTPPIPLIIGTWFGALVLTQYLLMRRYIQGAALYALANLASVIIFVQFIEPFRQPEVSRFVISGAFQGAVTGLSLLWLYGMAQQDKVKHKFAKDDAKIKHLKDDREEIDYQFEDGTDSTASTSL